MKKILNPENWPQTKQYLVLIVGGVLLLSVIGNEVFGRNGYLVRRDRRLQIESLTIEIDKLKHENVQLTHQIQSLRSKPDAIEKVAREQLRLGRPGDVVITFPTPQQGSQTSAH
jgi:cell division protein FtsB